jgi:hypothetical protein
MCQPETDKTRVVRRIAAIATLGAVLAGCSDLYYDRRDTIVLYGGDSIAANSAMQVIDPWPPYSSNTNIPFNGQRAQAAIDRYRNGKVKVPVDPTTSDVQNQQLSGTNAALQTTAASASTSAPPAPPGSASQ